MNPGDVERQIAEQIREIESLIAQMKEEQRLMGVQLVQLEVMLQRLRQVQASLKSVRLSE